MPSQSSRGDGVDPLAEGGAGTVLTGAVGAGGMSTWVALVEVVDAEFQDLQELASLWGDINVELGEVDAELQETYALLGRYDFLVVFEAPDRESVFEVSLAAERHGLDMDSMEGIPIEAFGGMVDQ
jgi:uncharacterized protein with GYD domain